MKKALLFAAAAAAAFAPAQARSPDPGKGERELARELEGRVAGEPVDCIDLHRVRSSRIIDRTAIVYDAGRTIYVNRPRSGENSLRNWDTMVVRPFGSRLCRVDTVHMVSPGSRMLGGIVLLGDFVPYKRVERASR
ncbi:MAG TPA: hypothetical protein VFQ67_00445 [Allosphingosinicella sp.]|jgi:hypothetical protein|nr:hypothetical protein [Allosphingosinicella sp.]